MTSLVVTSFVREQPVGQYANKKPITAALEFEQYSRLKYLSRESRVPMQEYLREGAELVLTKYEGHSTGTPAQSTLDLMRSNTAVVAELKKRSVIRTKNITGDYAEYLAAQTIGLELAPSSTPGFDGTDENGTRYQVKARQWTPTNKSRKLSAISDINGFDLLVAILFDPNWVVDAAAIIPSGIAKQLAKLDKRNNSYILYARDHVMKHSAATDITEDMKAVQESVF